MVKKDYEALKKCILQDYPFEYEWNDDEYYEIFDKCYNAILHDHAQINNPYYSNESGGFIRLQYLDHYVILCHRYANILWKSGKNEAAEVVYYSLRVRGGLDLFYRTEFGPCFMPVHALGAVIDSHSKYGKCFKFYDGVHIGPYSIAGVHPSKWKHPEFGDFVTVLAHCKIYGKTRIGNNVIVASGTTLINAKVPDNCIVTGTSPDLYFIPLKVSNEEILRNK